MVARTDDEHPGESRGDRFVRREDFSNSIPTQPPYTAFVGNLAFDLTENELEQFFSGIKVSGRSFIFHERLYESVQIKSVKIIKSKDEKPKGFGYIEFEDVDGLKDALLKTGSVRPPFLIWASLLTLGRIFLDGLFELVLLNHVRQLLLPFFIELF